MTASGRTARGMAIPAMPAAGAHSGHSGVADLGAELGAELGAPLAFLRAAARSARALLATGMLAIGLLAIGMLANTASAQAGAGAGFRVEVALPTLGVAPGLRGCVPLPGAQQLVAHRGDLFAASGSWPSQPARWFALGNDDIAFLAKAPDGALVAVGALLSGKVHVFDTRTGLEVAERFCHGVKNTFDAVLLPNGDLLLSANPLWPAGGSHSGLWLVGPGRSPRELLALQGPSGPLAWRPGGDLVLAELGPVVPPPPGAARLWQFPAARVQAAIAGGTLSYADASTSATGFAGIYDLAVDDHDRVYVTDPASALVRRSAPGGLAPQEVWLDLGPGRFATTLHFTAGTQAPFVAFQPEPMAGQLHVASTDYFLHYDWLRVHPSRPTAAVLPTAQVPPGSAQLQLLDGPPHGLVLWFAALQPASGEQALQWHGESPLWFGLSPLQAIVVQAGPLDHHGHGTVALLNPGGIAARLDLQAVTLDAPATGIASAAPVPLWFLP
jgi:hypothetical protein